MTKKLEKEFDLPPMEEVIEKAKEKANEQKTISEAEDKKIESNTLLVSVIAGIFSSTANKKCVALY